jgi:hypothetical protein
MGFCQFGGHDSNKIPRIGGNLITFQDDTLIWNLCNECKKYLGGDPAMDILLYWAREVSDISQLPNSLENDPLKQALLVQYVDKFLNLNIRIKLGNRFPLFLTDINEREKKYFLEELKQQAALSNIFMHDIQDKAKRETVALKLWVGATTGAKPTRSTYNTPGGYQEYTLQERQAGFQKADNLANVDEIVRAGVEIAPVLELVVRNHVIISLEGSTLNSPVRKYVMKNAAINFITASHLQIRRNSTAS